MTAQGFHDSGKVSDEGVTVSWPVTPAPIRVILSFLGSESVDSTFRLLGSGYIQLESDMAN